MNDLTQLLRANVEGAPPDHPDLPGLVEAGRRRVRHRRLARLGTGAAALATVAVAGVAVGVGADRGSDHSADRLPTPDAPVLRLADAAVAVEGTDYRVIASHTNADLDTDNGQYLDGVTDDGLLLFRDGPREGVPQARLALLDPATGAKDWLPDPGIGADEGTPSTPVSLTADRLVLLTGVVDPDAVDQAGLAVRLVGHVFDRSTRTWTRLEWAGLPDVEGSFGELGPDGRLYVAADADRAEPPAGGWPTGPDGEAEDADAAGDTYALWSVSLSDPTDVRDEGLRVGAFQLTDSSLVWTDRTDGDPGQVHVRDLATGQEHAFDPHTGERCNLLSFGATDERVVMSQYCGTYDTGRDDRVQVLTTDGEQVATVQDDDLSGWISSGGTGDLVTLTSYNRQHAGTYVYDLADDRFVRISDAVSSWGLGGTTTADTFTWGTPVNRGHGATQSVGELLP